MTLIAVEVTVQVTDEGAPIAFYSRTQTVQPAEASAAVNDLEALVPPVIKQLSDEGGLEVATQFEQACQFSELVRNRFQDDDG